MPGIFYVAIGAMIFDYGSLALAKDPIIVLQQAPAGVFPTPFNGSGTLEGVTTNRYYHLRLDGRSQTTQFAKTLMSMGPGTSMSIVATANGSAAGAISNGAFSPGWPQGGSPNGWVPNYRSPVINGELYPWQYTVPGSDGHKMILTEALGHMSDGTLGGNLTMNADQTLTLTGKAGLNRCYPEMLAGGSDDRLLSRQGRAALWGRISQYVPSDVYVRNSGSLTPSVRGSMGALKAGYEGGGGGTGVAVSGSMGLLKGVADDYGVDPRLQAGVGWAGGTAITYAQGNMSGAMKFQAVALPAAGAALVLNAAGATPGTAELGGIYTAMGAGAATSGPVGAISVGVQTVAFKSGEGAYWLGRGFLSGGLTNFVSLYEEGYNPISFYLGK